MAFDKSTELGGLWLKTSARGQEFMSGKLTLPDGTVQEVVLFRNDKKQPGERTPDWRVYRSEPREGQTYTVPAPQSGPHPQRGGSGRSAPRDLDDSIPFVWATILIAPALWALSSAGVA